LRTIEQPFGLQPGLQAQKLFEKLALARAFHSLDDELQIAACLVDAQLRPDIHAHAFTRHEVEFAGGAAKHGATQLPVRVLESEVTVAAGSPGKPGNLPAHRDRIEPCLQGIGHGAAQGPNLPDQRRRSFICSIRHKQDKGLQRISDCESSTMGGNRFFVDSRVKTWRKISTSRGTY